MIGAQLAPDRAPPRLLPPYGREVVGELAARRAPNVRLYACRPDPWPLARAHREAFGPGSTLVLPVGVDPLSLRWPPLRNVVANVTGLPGDTLRALAHALVRDGLRLGYLLDGDRPDRSLRVVRKVPSP